MVSEGGRIGIFFQGRGGTATIFKGGEGTASNGGVSTLFRVGEPFVLLDRGGVCILARRRHVIQF